MDQVVIKYRYCFLLALSLVATCTLQAQVNSEKLKKRVTIYKDAMRVDSFLNLLSRQTGVGFSFNSKKISPTKMISMKKGIYSMADCLAHIQRHSGIHYAMMNNHIILVDNPPQEQYRLQLPAKEPQANKPHAGNPQPNKLQANKRPAGKPAAKRPITTKPTNQDTLIPSTSVPSPATAQTNAQKTTVQPGAQQPLPAANSPKATNSSNPKQDSLAKQPATTSSTRIPPPTRADSLRKARAEAAKARQEAAAAAAAAAAEEEKNEAFTATNLLVGVSMLRPDIYNMFGPGINLQFETFPGNKISLTAAAGFHQIFGEYFAGSKVDSAGVPIGDSLAKNFRQIPLLLGVRYYLLRPFYVAFEGGYSVKASNNVSSYLSVCPSVGVKLPVGESHIDLNINYLYMNGKTTYPELSKLEKGGFGLWCFRVAYSFK